MLVDEPRIKYTKPMLVCLFFFVMFSEDRPTVIPVFLSIDLAL